MTSTYYDSTGKSVVSGNVAKASDLNIINTAVDTAFIAVEADTVANSSAIDAIELEIDGIDDSIVDINNTIDGIELEIDGIDTSITDINDDIATINTTISYGVLVSRSSTSNTVESGVDKTFILAESGTFIEGTAVLVAYRLEEDIYMHGYVVSYDDPTKTLVVRISNKNGSGTYDDWAITLSSHTIADFNEIATQVHEETVVAGGKDVFFLGFEILGYTKNMLLFADGVLQFDAFPCDISGVEVTSGTTRYVNAGSVLPEGTEVKIYSSTTSALGYYPEFIAPVANLEDLRSLEFQVANKKYSTLGHTSIGDGGGGDFIYYSGSPSGTYVDDDGVTIVPTGGDGSSGYVRETNGDINLLSFGPLYNGTDESDKVRRALAAADSLGVNVEVNGDIYAPNLLHTEYPNTRLVGTGRITGAYRRFVITPDSPSPDVRCVDYQDAKLAALRANKNPVVVLVGDSISTEGAALAQNRAGFLSTSIRTKVMNTFDSPTFLNRAISGQNYETFNGIPTLFAEWYIDELKPWLEYIEELEPDWLILGFGMNDKIDFSSVAFLEVMAKINAWTKVPTVTFASNLVPSLDGTPGNAATLEVEDQEGRDFAAGYIRTYAQRYGYSLLDFNRQQHMARDGFDIIYGSVGEQDENLPVVLDGTSEEVQGSRQVYNTVYKFKIDEVDYALLGLIDSTISLRLGGSGNDIIRIRNNGGFYQFSANSGSDASDIDDVFVSSLEIGTEVITMHIQKYGNIVTGYVFNSVLDKYSAPIFTFKKISCGGLFTPVIRATTAGIISQCDIFYDRPTIYSPSIKDIDLFGGDPIGAVYPGATEFSGNGYNHPSNKAHGHIYLPVLDGLALRAASVEAETPAQSGSYTPTVGYTAGITSQTVYPATYFKVGDIVTVSGSFLITPSGTTGIRLTFNLPIPGVFEDKDYLSGVATLLYSGSPGTNTVGRVFGYMLPTRGVEIFARPGTLTDWELSYTFQYPASAL